MKVIILAGGYKSTISDSQEGIPKPMVEIGEKPLLWHIMKQYSFFGYEDFLVCGGYRINVIKDYFRDFYIYQSDIQVDLATNQIQILKKITENWKVTIADTGLYASTGQRVSRSRKYVGDEMFLVTYGDCLSDINITSLVRYAETQNKIVTMAVAKPTGRNEIVPVGEDGLLDNLYMGYGNSTSAWVNACTYVFKRDVFNYLNGNYELERQLLPVLSAKKQVAVYRHEGFWRPVETMRDKVDLENRWNAETAPWKVWNT